MAPPSPPTTAAAPAARPSSPAELSYTKLARLAPSFGGAGGSSANHRNDSHHGGIVAAAAATSMPSAPRTAPPASISVPRIIVGNAVGTTSEGFADYYYHTPHQIAQRRQQAAVISMSAPQPHAARPLAPLREIEVDRLKERSTPLENRLSNLALKLHSMHMTPENQSDPHIPDMAHHHHRRHRSDRMNEVRQFIETLKNMQAAVSRTEDEHQRIKKSRALNALLSMFESIVEERRVTTTTHPSSETSVRQLEGTARRLQSEVKRLELMCQERDGKLRRLQDELQRSRLDSGRVAEENERLRNELAEERERARESELVASESEGARDGLLADYARITEENVELRRDADDAAAERDRTATEIRALRRETGEARAASEELTRLLREKDSVAAEMERRAKDLNGQLVTQRNLLQSANNDRRQLQDELHSSRRNSTAASRQLVQLRDQFSRFRQDACSVRQHHRTREPVQGVSHGMRSKGYGHKEGSENAPSHYRNNKQGALVAAAAAAAAARDDLGRTSRARSDTERKVGETGSHLHHPNDSASQQFKGVAAGVQRTSNNLDNKDAANESMDTSQPRLRKDTELKAEDNDLDSLLEQTSELVRPMISQKSPMDELSLDWKESIKNEVEARGGVCAASNTRVPRLRPENQQSDDELDSLFECSTVDPAQKASIFDEVSLNSMDSVLNDHLSDAAFAKSRKLHSNSSMKGSRHNL